MAAEGLTEVDLSTVDVPEAVNAAADSPDVSDETRTALQSFGSSSAASGSAGATTTAAAAGTQSAEHVAHQLNHVTYTTYEGDEIITQKLDFEFNSIDNSLDLEVDGDFSIDASSSTANGDGAVANNGDGDVTAATGDGAVATSGDGAVNALTGDGSQLVDGDLNTASGDGALLINGDNSGQANTGEGAVQAGDDIEGTVNTGDGAVTAGDDVEGSVNTGLNNGIVADDVDNAVVGDGNQTAQVDFLLTGAPQSVYVLDKATATPVPGKAGQPLRIDLEGEAHARHAGS